MKIHPPDSLIQFAQTTMFQAELAPHEQREALLLEVKDALLKVEMESPGRGAWLMACVNARLGNPPLVHKWLERAHQSGSLPSRMEIVSSAYMTDMQGHIWFQEFVAGLE